MYFYCAASYDGQQLIASDKDIYKFKVAYANIFLHRYTQNISLLVSTIAEIYFKQNISKLIFR